MEVQTGERDCTFSELENGFTPCPLAFLIYTESMVHLNPHP